MSGQGKRRSIYAIGLLIIFLAWTLCLAQAQKIQQWSHTVEIRYEGYDTTMKALQDIQKSEQESDKKLINNMTAWTQDKDKKAVNQELSKSMNVDVLEIYGDLNQLLPRDKIIGQSLRLGDEEGIVISRDIAEQLWGNTDVIGKCLTLEEEDYIIRGIISEDTSQVVRSMKGSEETEGKLTISGLRLDFIDNENINQQVDVFRNKYYLPEGVVINLSLMSILVSQLAFLPGWLVGFWALAKVYRLIYQYYEYWVATIILTLCTLVVTGLVLEIMQFAVHIPTYLIPGRWSDFEFWSRLADTFAANRKSINALPTFAPDLWRVTGIQHLCFALGITLIGLVGLLRKVEIKAGKDLFWKMMIAIGCSFVAIIISYLGGVDVIVIRSYWVMIPIYLVIQWGCIKWNDFFRI